MSILKPAVHEFRQTLRFPREEVFAWHARPGAFPRLQAPWLPGRVVTEADSLADGTAVLGFPAGRRWVARHQRGEYVEGQRFADRLTSRPFLVPLTWHHRHDFEADGDATVVVDRVTTSLPRRILDPMFTYRHRQLADDLAAHRLTAGSAPLTVAVTGASGLIGSALTAFLTTGGHTVIRLVRRPPDVTGAQGSLIERQWDPDDPDPRALEGVDAVVHLAGHSIAGRFTADHKRRVRDSRVAPTRKLARAAAAAGVPAFISASAIGFYGADRGDEELTENAAPGDDFLARVVQEWEEAALEAAAAELRVVTVRTGIVQSPRGGALRLQRPLFAAGLGGQMGAGDHWQAWIGIDDLVDVYHRALVDDRLSGAVNAVAPQPVRQRDYASALGRALRRPTVLPTPAFGPALLLGREGAREMAFANQRVVPARLLELDHRFRATEVEDALRHLLGSAHP